MKSESLLVLLPLPKDTRLFEFATAATAPVAVEFEFDEVLLDTAENAPSSTWQTVPSAGSVPFAKYARE